MPLRIDIASSGVTLILLRPFIALVILIVASATVVQGMDLSENVFTNLSMLSEKFERFVPTSGNLLVSPSRVPEKNPPIISPNFVNIITRLSRPFSSFVPSTSLMSPARAPTRIVIPPTTRTRSPSAFNAPLIGTACSANITRAVSPIINPSEPTALSSASLSVNSVNAHNVPATMPTISPIDNTAAMAGPIFRFSIALRTVPKANITPTK